MLISELLIAGFLVYWLQGQYRKEKSGLKDELYEYYKESYSITIDSMLVRHVIEPVMGKESVFYSNSNAKSKIMQADSISLFTAVINSDSDSINNVKGDVVHVKINSRNDSAESDSKGFPADRDSVFLEGLNVLSRSIRLIIERSSDSTGDISFITSIRNGPDTSLFKNEYILKLKENNLDFEPVWIYAGDISAGNRSIVLEDDTGTLPSVMIDKPGLYITGRILPQIVFSLVLIIVSSLAFLLAYKSIREQIRMNNLRNSFISNISHELKTPVSTVKIAIEALGRYGNKYGSITDPEGYLEMASKEIRRLEMLISKVLDQSVIEQDAGIMDFGEVDLSVLTAEAIRSLQTRIDEAGARIVFNAPSEVIVWGDPLYLQGVIVNLLDNSLKYGNDKPAIEVCLSAGTRDAVLTVSDNGPGIPEEYKKKIFEKFFRVPDKDRHNVKGYGLGLSFAQLVIKMHGGSIDVRNNERGCTFTIRMPLRET